MYVCKIRPFVCTLRQFCYAGRPLTNTSTPTEQCRIQHTDHLTFLFQHHEVHHVKSIRNKRAG